MKPKFIRTIDGIPCITLGEHKHIVANLRREWRGLTEEERIRLRSLGLVGVEIVEDLLEERNRD